MRRMARLIGAALVAGRLPPKGTNETGLSHIDPWDAPPRS